MDNATVSIASAVSNELRAVEPLNLPRQYPLEDVQRVHEILIENLPAGDFNESNRGKLLTSARQVIDRLGLTYSSPERDEMASQVVDEIIGNGPIEPLIREDRISDIQINGSKDVFVKLMV